MSTGSPKWFRRTVTLTAVLTAAVVGGVCLLQARPVLHVAEAISTFALGMGKGSPSYARHWKEALSGVASPEEARARYPEAVAKRFPSGEWVVAVSKDSHDSPWGGTVVVRDSAGRVRAFFGHVCGDGHLAGYLRDKNSLAEFYGGFQTDDFMRACGFKEYNFPP